MARCENSSISGIKFPYWPEDFAVSSAGAHHPIYSSALWSLECQPLAETNDGQPLQLINYAKAINALSKQRPSVCLAWLLTHSVKSQKLDTYKRSIPLIKGVCWQPQTEGKPQSWGVFLLRWQQFMGLPYEKGRLFYRVGWAEFMVSNSHLIHCMAFTPQVQYMVDLGPNDLWSWKVKRRGICFPIPGSPLHF